MHRNPLSFIILSLLLTLAAACVATAPPAGEGGSAGSPSEGGRASVTTGWSFTGPACYFNDDCGWSDADGGACVEGTCVPHPPGWCLLTSLCPLPPNTSCASAWCDPYTEQCAFNDAPKGSGCWVGPDAGKHECDGHGACVPADTGADAGAD